MQCILDFGKFVGKDIWDSRAVPDSYVLWLSAQPNTNETLREICRTRLGLHTPRVELGKIKITDELECAILRRWQRIMAAEYSADLDIVNKGKEVLQSVLESAK